MKLYMLYCDLQGGCKHTFYENRESAEKQLEIEKMQSEHLGSLWKIEDLEIED